MKGIHIGDEKEKPRKDGYKAQSVLEQNCKVRNEKGSKFVDRYLSADTSTNLFGSSTAKRVDLIILYYIGGPEN